MKIVFCLHHFLPEYVAGTEVYTFNLAKKLIDLGIEPLVVIPNYKSDITEEYIYEGIRVIKYAENSIEDRAMILGVKKPDGLPLFIDILSREKPDIVHVHELAPGSGTNLFHVEAIHALKIPVVVTFHLSHYSCYTGSLFYKGVVLCDGRIDIKKCTRCAYHHRGVKGFKSELLNVAANSLFGLKIDPLKWNNPIGTALGFPFLIKKIKNDLLYLSEISSRIVVLTKWYRSVLELNGVPAEKISYIPQGLTGDRAAKVAQLSSASLPLKLIFVGRVSYYKGVHLLIDAIKKLPPSKIILDIYGPDTDDDYALKCKEESSSMSNIHWKGPIASSKMIDVMSEYDVLCLPSTFSEMSPLVIQEAYAAGIPVIASNVYGNAEQIQDGINGWLFKFNNSDDLSNKIFSLISDPALIEQAKKRLPQVVPFSSIAKEYKKVYSSVLNTEVPHT